VTSGLPPSSTTVVAVGVGWSASPPCITPAERSASVYWKYSSIIVRCASLGAPFAAFSSP
jgi:hypothetical protein